MVKKIKDASSGLINSKQYKKAKNANFLTNESSYQIIDQYDQYDETQDTPNFN